MFGFVRRASAEVGMNVILSKLKGSLVAPGERLSDKIWHDPYVLGYVFTAATSMLHEANGPANQYEKAGPQSLRCLSTLTGRTTGNLAHDIGRLTDSQNLQFESGSDRGLLWALLMKGKANAEHPEVIELVEGARRLGDNLVPPENPFAAAAGLAVTRDFILPVQELNRRMA